MVGPRSDGVDASCIRSLGQAGLNGLPCVFKMTTASAPADLDRSLGERSTVARQVRNLLPLRPMPCHYELAAQFLEYGTDRGEPKPILS